MIRLTAERQKRSRPTRGITFQIAEVPIPRQPFKTILGRISRQGALSQVLT